MSLPAIASFEKLARRAEVIGQRHRRTELTFDVAAQVAAVGRISLTFDGHHQMVHEGHRLLGAAIDLATDARARTDRIDGLHVLDDELLGHQASHDLDRLQMLIDVTELGVSGYQCADSLRGQRHLDLGMSDHRRVLATLSIADDATTVDRLIQALTDVTRHAPTLPAATPIDVPAPDELALETACAPHTAFFGPTVQVPADRAAGRVAAEQLTPYPPGIPVVVPGERLDAAVIAYLRSGLAAGMAVPDATDPSLDTFRVPAMTNRQ